MSQPAANQPARPEMHSSDAPEGHPLPTSPIAGAVRHLARILILGSLLGVLLFAFYVLVAILRAG